MHFVNSANGLIAIITCTEHRIFVQWESVPIEKVNASKIKLKVYIENSGSMNGYMQQKSELKDAVKSYVSALDLQVDTTELFYINSIITPISNVNISSLEDVLNPLSLANGAGNKANSDIAEMLNAVISHTTNNSVSLFVSDCILDVPQGNAVNYFGVKQTSITRTFAKALRKNPNLGVEIFRLMSSYNGMYYYSKGYEPFDGKRPYYMWVIGNKNVLALLNKKVPFSTILHGYENYVAYSTTTKVPFDVSTSVKKNKVKGKLNGKGQYEFNFMLDMSETLQEESILENLQYYTTRTEKNVSVSNITRVQQGTEYTHVLTLAISNNTKPCSETVLFIPVASPAWIKEMNDDSGSCIKKNENKTTGIKYLIQGVSNAYKDYSTLATIDFKIKNK